MRCLLLLLAVLAALAPSAAAAHPLGTFTVNQYSRITAGHDAVRVRYIVDMAEIPAFQERQAIDTDGDGQVTEDEGRVYLDRQAASLPGGLRLTADGAPLALAVIGRELAFPEGQGGLPTLRLTLELAAALPPAEGPRALAYHVENYAERLGWREIVAVAGEGAALRDATVAPTDVSGELRAYPEDLLASPLDVRAARFTVIPAAAPSRPAEPPAGAWSAAPRDADRLAGLVAGELTPPTMAGALLLALLLGAGHALTPGHGKTVVAAYLVGARGTARHAIILGLTTTITHTAGVFLLGVVTLAASRYVLPERIYPWLELVSGALVVAIGLGLLRGRLARLRRGGGRGEPLAGRGVTADRPAPSALPHTHDDPHDHDHLHHHGPGGHTHEHEAQIADALAGSGAERVRWRSLVALGVSGGLLPCPSALVVLLSAIALGRVGFGMLLITAFSLGLAGVLTGIGLLLVRARGLFDRLPTDGRLLRALPVASAAIVTLLGAGITAAALGQMR